MMGVIEIHDNHVEKCHNKTHYYIREIRANFKNPATCRPSPLAI